MKAKSLPPGSNKRKDLFNRAVTNKRQLSLDRIDPGFWSLAMRQVKPMEDGRVLCDGRSMSMFASNDYLSLSNHAEVRSAAVEAIHHWGTSTSGSRLLNGTLPTHEQLEAHLRELERTQAVVLFQNGYMANLGTLSVVLGANDAVFVDSLVHSSVIDGCKMSGARLYRFPHQNVERFEEKLNRLHPSISFLVVVDGIYSMDGDFAPLAELLDITHKYGGKLMVDDAHATGVAGPKGGGSAEHLGLQEADIVTGTLSKAFGSMGGYLATNETFARLVKANAHPFIYSTSPSPAAAAAADKALEIAGREPERRMRLWKNTKYLRTELNRLGLNTGSSVTPIIPVIFEDEETMLRLAQALDKADIFVAPVIFPACPKNSPRLRFTVTSSHTIADIDEIIETLGSDL
jgi:8-amino-7-oxononanoate synthase